MVDSGYLVVNSSVDNFPVDKWISYPQNESYQQTNIGLIISVFVVIHKQFSELQTIG
jgi:hypothetical protein